MITLAKLVEDQKWNEMSDIQVIKTFFDVNNLEEEGINLITELSRIKIEKLKRKEAMVKEWISYLPSKYLYENYDLDIADHLHTLELDFLSNGGNLSAKRLKWAKENLSHIKQPQLYFNPLVEWLNKNDVYFMDQK